MEPIDKASELGKLLEKERNRVTELEANNRALVAEFSKADSYEDTLKIAREAIKDILPLAITTVKSLIASADSESVRASLSKYVMDTVLSNKLDSGSNSDVADLLKNLAKNDPKFREEALEVVDKHKTD